MHGWRCIWLWLLILGIIWILYFSQENKIFTKVLFIFHDEVICMHPYFMKTCFNSNKGNFSMKKDYLLILPQDLHHWIPVLNNKWKFLQHFMVSLSRLYIMFHYELYIINLLFLQILQSYYFRETLYLKYRKRPYRHSLIIRIIHFIKIYTILILAVIE